MDGRFGTLSNFPVGNVRFVPIIAPPTGAHPLTCSQVIRSISPFTRPSIPLCTPNGLWPDMMQFRTKDLINHENIFFNLNISIINWKYKKTLDTILPNSSIYATTRSTNMYNSKVHSSFYFYWGSLRPISVEKC